MSKFSVLLAAAVATLGVASSSFAALTVDLRVMEGSSVSSSPKSVVGAEVGDVVQLGLFATVTGANSVGTDDGLQSLFGSVVSTLTGNGSVIGDMSAFTLTSTFAGANSAPGTVQNINGQPGLDVGGTVATSAAGFIAPRSSTITLGTSATSGTTEFFIGTLNFTITGVPTDGTTSLSFIPRATTNIAVWREDGVARINNATNGGVFVGGAPVSVSAVVPEPAAIGMAVPALALLARRRRA